MKNAIKIFALIMAVVICTVMLVSCSPASDPDDALAALKDNGYIASKDSTAVPIALGVLGVKDIDSVVAGTKKVDDKVEVITIVYFKSKDAAKAAWETVEEYAQDKEDDSNNNSDFVIKKSGSMIYFGTEDAIKAAR